MKDIKEVNIRLNTLFDLIVKNRGECDFTRGDGSNGGYNKVDVTDIQAARFLMKVEKLPVFGRAILTISTFMECEYDEIDMMNTSWEGDHIYPCEMEVTRIPDRNQEKRYYVNIYCEAPTMNRKDEEYIYIPGGAR